ncbi:MAG: hypothetical protein IKI25_10945 [Bacteroidales bacterium]|nr:hypothetical protein [Salinivirgaceae bacterium]MBR7036261.1 hypothetical protein [Bacteroidales bacterium]
MKHNILSTAIAMLIFVGSAHCQPLVSALNAATVKPDNKTTAYCPPMGNGRNLVYLLNPKDVASVAGYAALIFNLGFGQCRYDSLITVIQGYDMCAVESQLEKAHVARPARERKLYDSTGRTTRSLEAAAQGCNLLLFENRKLIFSCQVQEYMPKEQTSYFK